MPYSHNAQSIYTIIYELFKFYSIEEKVLTITFDNAYTNIAAIRLFKDNILMILNGLLFYQYCACHITNLVVQLGLQLIEAQIQKIRECLSFIMCFESRC